VAVPYYPAFSAVADAAACCTFRTLGLDTLFSDTTAKAHTSIMVLTGAYSSVV
jgi:hypothetical protein